MLNSIPLHTAKLILCCYRNTTPRLRVVRSANVPNWYFERVVFPGQNLLFEAPPEALLEIYSGSVATAILADRIPCQQLQVQQEPASDYPASAAVPCSV
jgi:hypothetical protein